ncbi:hypothetical protein F5887DRAFT_1201922 [Amanita rubescens]|nr:hypothetical protein F5887DRAFT_1201922 [Amanita rubescens]
MSYFLNKAGKNLFRKHIEQYVPPDPLYEYTTDNKGRQKRSKRPLPPGLSKRDARILKSVQTRAHHLDKGFNLCGLRFGWTFFIALIPIVGSVADALINYYLIIRKARKADIPQWLEAKMILNSTIGVGASFVPFVGDIFLAIWKANSRNAVLLEEYLRIRGEEILKVQREREASGSQLNTATTTTTVDNSKKDKFGFFSFSRWRGGETKPEAVDSDTATENPTPEEVYEDEPVAVLPSSVGHETSTAEGGDGSKRKGFFSSLGKRKAPPAGEKGRFIEHVPEADYEQWISPPVQ